MKIVFVGPTLPGAASLAPGLEIRAPAVQGDLYGATEAGASAIGLIDGGFEYTAPVWHKEILHALSQGVAVFGAASMGALRAAECHAFGMTGVGAIADEYISGLRTDDSDVAQLHAPEALGWASLTEPLVNITATLRRPSLRDLLSPDVCDRLETIARQMHFKDRSWPAILKHHAPEDADLRHRLHTAIKPHVVNRKRDDALLLIDAMMAHPGQRSRERPDWRFQETTLWREMVARRTPKTEASDR